MDIKLVDSEAECKNYGGKVPTLYKLKFGRHCRCSGYLKSWYSTRRRMLRLSSHNSHSTISSSSKKKKVCGTCE